MEQLALFAFPKHDDGDIEDDSMKSGEHSDSDHSRESFKEDIVLPEHMSPGVLNTEDGQRQVQRPLSEIILGKTPSFYDRKSEFKFSNYRGILLIGYWI